MYYRVHYFVCLAKSFYTAYSMSVVHRQSFLYHLILDKLSVHTFVMTSGGLSFGNIL